MYCSDITTTYPVGGKFGEKQKEIYNIVLGVALLMRQTLVPGKTYDDVNKAGMMHMVRELEK